MTLRRTVFLFVLALAVLAASAAVALDRPTMLRLARALAIARHDDEPTRRFVELFLRSAGVVWVTVEWIAAVYLVRGYAMLRRWLSEAAR